MSKDQDAKIRTLESKVYALEQELKDLNEAFDNLVNENGGLQVELGVLRADFNFLTDMVGRMNGCRSCSCGPNA